MSTMRFMDAPKAKKISQRRDKCEWKSRRPRGLPQIFVIFEQYLNHGMRQKKKRRVGGVSYRALLGKCTHEKAAVEGEKGFALRRDQNNGEKTGCLPRPDLF